MFCDFLDVRTALIVFLGLVVPVTGVLGALSCRRSHPAEKRTMVPVPTGILTLVLGWLGVEWGTGVVSETWLVPGIGSLLTWTATLGRTSHRARQVAKRWLSPQVQWGSLIVMGPALAVSLAWTRDDIEVLSNVPNYSVERDKLVQVATVTTDLGRPVVLYRTKDGRQQRMLYSDVELKLMEQRKIQQVGCPDGGYNCFGWVFAEGRFVLSAQDVNLILADNGYQLTDDPRCSDIVVYRDAAGSIVHAGTVSAASDDEVMVESKWGLYSRFVHPVNDCVYRARPSYYRSHRGSNRLYGLPMPKVNTAANDESRLVATAWSLTLRDWLNRMVTTYGQ